jgi:hypothetical protein
LEREFLDELFAPNETHAIGSSLAYKHFVPKGLRKILLRELVSPYVFHVCKLLIEKGITERRWRVQFAGSVAEAKIVR